MPDNKPDNLDYAKPETEFPAHDPMRYYREPPANDVIIWIVSFILILAVFFVIFRFIR
jgi:hypothetical protein